MYIQRVQRCTNGGSYSLINLQQPPPQLCASTALEALPVTRKSSAKPFGAVSRVDINSRRPRMRTTIVTTPAFHVATPLSLNRRPSSASPCRSSKMALFERYPSPTHSAEALLSIFRGAIPTLNDASHKGQHGRIAFLGGSEDYTGAPYYAAMSALRAGGDLATVYCGSAAAPALKALAPELVVPSCGIDVRTEQLRNAHAIVVGPGLGRSPEAEDAVYRAVEHGTVSGIPVVMDADALWFLSRSTALRDLVRCSPRSAFILATPNARELQRIRDALGARRYTDIVDRFEGRLAMLCKGADDVVMCGEMPICAQVGSPGSRKRAGGLGDILAGVAGLFAYWANSACQQGKKTSGSSNAELQAAAAVAASAVARRAAHIAFQKRGRSLVASDALDEIRQAVVELEHGSLRTRGD